MALIVTEESSNDGKPMCLESDCRVVRKGVQVVEKYQLIVPSAHQHAPIL